MRFVGAVRKEMGIRTMFNVLGPISNPAGATQMLLGVYEEKLVEPLAHVLSNLGVKRAMVVYGTDGMDEISFNSFSLLATSASIFTPKASRQSAVPHLLDAARLPCFATGYPAADVTIEASVEILNVFEPSPPVPTISNTSLSL